MDKYEIIGDLKNKILAIPIERVINLRMQPRAMHKYLCPFHDDHSPDNFKITKRNNYACYACGAKGNAISFIQEYDGIDNFADAVLKLSYELGIITSDDYENLKKEPMRKGGSVPKTPDAPKQKKVVPTTTYTNDIGTPEELNSVYRIFVRGYELIGQPKLTESHIEEIKRKRFLDESEIAKDEYFTFPDNSIMDALIKEMETQGLDLDLLKKIPGFYYSVPKKKWFFTLLKDTTAIGIPIKDLNGNIIAVQIRLDEVSEGKKRYQWFSSSFANSSGKENSKAKTIYGTSPGAPIAVVKPDVIKYKTLFITEGFFKARTIAKYYQSYALSVQGVTNWKNIVEVVDALRADGVVIKCIYIAFDGDMCRKDTVIKPAIKMGLALTELDFSDTMNDCIEKILKSSNRSPKEKVGNFKEENEGIVQFLKENEDDFSSKIIFLLWNEMEGKGIDDILNAKLLNNADIKLVSDIIKPMHLIDFWSNAYELLSELDEIREQRAIETNVPYRSVKIEDNIKQDLFVKHIGNKLNEKR